MRGAGNVATRERMKRNKDVLSFLLLLRRLAAFRSQGSGPRSTVVDVGRFQAGPRDPVRRVFVSA